VNSERFDAKAAVRFFGGPADLARRAKKHGFPVTIKAIEKWQERNQIPGPWLVRLSAIAKSENRLFEISDFITRPQRAPQENLA
jgi:hypothetical protein